MRAALVSEHASPLAGLGGADGGGQNVYVGHIARRLAARGWRVDVFTRRDRADLPEVVPLTPGARRPRPRRAAPLRPQGKIAPLHG